MKPIQMYQICEYRKSDMRFMRTVGDKLPYGALVLKQRSLNAVNVHHTYRIEKAK